MRSVMLGLHLIASQLTAGAVAYMRHRPGTFKAKRAAYCFFTRAQADLASGWKASLPGIVASSL
jgi:hypothetical protein